MHESRSALIVGAGIGGLAAGVALRRAGYDIRIHERAASPRELGFGLLLAPNALSALAELGITGPFLRRGDATTGVEIRRIDGRPIRRFITHVGSSSIVALRSDLHGALLNAIGNDALRLGSEAVSFRRDGATVTLRSKSGDTDTASLLIGADGVNSVIRKTLHPHEAAPRPSGFCAVRGVAYGVSECLGSLSAVGYLDDGIEAATARAGNDAVYWYVSLLSNDVGSELRTPKAILEQRITDFESPLQTILATTNAEDMRFDELLERDPLRAWGAGPVTLLGDAAHPLLPHTGQGAAQALEDAVALGLAVSLPVSVGQALRQYERIRFRRTRTFVRIGPRIARVTTTRSAWIQNVRTVAIRLVPQRVIRWSELTLGIDPHRALRKAASRRG